MTQSLRSNGSYIGPRPAGPSTSTASGIWDLRTAERQNRNSQWPAFASDPYFANVSLLLHMNGSNGATTFTDSSGSPKTVTANGGAAISTSQSKFGGASAYFDGNGDWVTVPSDASLAFGTGDFTVECWAYRNGGGTYGGIVNVNGYADGVFFRYESAGGAAGYQGFVGGVQYNSNVTTTGQWVHLAITRASGTVRVFVNGTQTNSGQNSYDVSGGTAMIGSSQHNTSEAFTGWIDEVRITKGVARYTANFTPPTAAFPDA